MIKQKIIFASVMFLFYSIGKSEEQPDLDKTYRLAHYVFGQDGEALLKEKSMLDRVNLKNNFLSSDGNTIGFLGSSLSGVNPFSPSGVSLAGAIDLGFSLFSLAKDIVTEPTYMPRKIQGDFFGKYYLAEDAANDKEALQKMRMNVLTAAKKSAMDNLGMHAYCLPSDDDCRDYARHGMKYMVIKLMDHEVTDPKELTKIFSSYALFVTHDGMLMSSQQPERDKTLGFTPSFETKAEDGFRLTLRWQKSPKEGLDNPPELLKEEKWLKFIAEVNHHDGVLTMTPNLKTFFHHGNIYTQHELIQAHMKFIEESTENTNNIPNNPRK